MANASIYFYETEIEWIGGKDLQISSGKLPVIAGGAPPEFKGREGVWAPEHLFVAALNSCYLLTLLAIAEFSKIAIVSCSSSAKGKLEKVEGGTYQITEIVVQTAHRDRLGQRSRAHAAHLRKSQRKLLHLKLDQERDQDRAGSVSSSDSCFTVPVGSRPGIACMH